MSLMLGVCAVVLCRNGSVGKYTMLCFPHGTGGGQDSPTDQGSIVTFVSPTISDLAQNWFTSQNRRCTADSNDREH
jgi:hypothetical protein